MTVVAVGGDVFAGGEEPAGEPAIEKYSRLSTILIFIKDHRPSKPCRIDIVDEELTSLGFQVQNRYSWSRAGSPDKPAHIGPHRASLPKAENDICSK